MQRLFENRTLSWWACVPGAVLTALYAMLSWLAFTNQTFFFESMTIPIPEHFFVIWSWGGKNTAMVVVLLLSVVSRRALPLTIACAMLLTGQLGDINAGLRTDVNVFITWVALALTLAQFAAIYTALKRSEV